jgi:hypothetical protein
MLKIIIYISCSLCAISAFGQGKTPIINDDTVRTVVGTLYFAGYRADNVAVKYEENWYENEYQIYLCEKKLLTSFRYYPGPELYNFNPHRAPRYFQDINGDGKGEIIFVVESGGSGGDMSAFIYTLDTIATKIGDFGELDKELRGLELTDIDGDSILEVIFGDNHFNYWPYGNGAMGSVSLVWKWDGENYRLANFKLGDYILQHIYGKLAASYLDLAIQDTFTVQRFDSNDEMSYPVSLMESMLNLFYAGDSIKSIDLFNTVWPDVIPHKREFYTLFREKMESSSHWQELQQSNW